MATIYLEFLSGFGWMAGAMLGLAVVAIPLAIMLEAARWVTGGSAFRKSMEKNNEDSIAALKRRNELTVQQNDLAVRAVEQFVRVAEAAEAIRWRYVDGV